MIALSLLPDAEHPMVRGVADGGFRVVDQGNPPGWADLCIAPADPVILSGLTDTLRPRWILVAGEKGEFGLLAGYQTAFLDHPSGLRIALSDRLAAPALPEMGDVACPREAAAILARALTARPCGFCSGGGFGGFPARS